nr:classical arabinogalactan protein 9-like [Lolium perenne]
MPTSYRKCPSAWPGCEPQIELHNSQSSQAESIPQTSSGSTSEPPDHSPASSFALGTKGTRKVVSLPYPSPGRRPPPRPGRRPSPPPRPPAAAAATPSPASLDAALRPPLLHGGVGRPRIPLAAPDATRRPPSPDAGRNQYTAIHRRRRGWTTTPPRRCASTPDRRTDAPQPSPRVGPSSSRTDRGGKPPPPTSHRPRPCSRNRRRPTALRPPALAPHGPPWPAICSQQG